MKTPYDAALRLRQREIDAVSEQIARTNGEIAQIEGEGRALDSELRVQASLADAEHRFATASAAYFARKRAELANLAARARTAQEQLDALREQAISTLGSLRSIEGAATLFREEAEREEARGEQASADDLAAISFIQARREWLRGQPR